MARTGATTAVTQNDLSGRLASVGVSLDRSGIAKVESGVRSVSDYEVRAFCKALRVSPEWLLGMKDDSSR
ncbi:MAG: XRE family transcriptional regulator [Opitutus sp.]|nr:XRE family transcriptional regulator [Opitutus sp.]